MGRPRASSCESLAKDLAGKIVVDCVNPLGFDEQGAYALAVEEGSAAAAGAALLPDARVVAAFHHLSAVAARRRRRLRSTPTCWSWVTTAPPPTSFRRWPPVSRAARHLRRPAAQRPPGGVPVANLISINRRYKAHAGLKITDV